MQSLEGMGDFPRAEYDQNWAGHASTDVLEVNGKRIVRAQVDGSTRIMEEDSSKTAFVVGIFINNISFCHHSFL